MFHEALSGRVGAGGKVTDLSDGRYTVAFVLLTAASYELDVNVAGVTIERSPVLVDIVAARAKASESTASGAGVGDEVLQAGMSARVAVRVRDRFGNGHNYIGLYIVMAYI